MLSKDSAIDYAFLIENFRKIKNRNNLTVESFSLKLNPGKSTKIAF